VPERQALEPHLVIRTSRLGSQPQGGR